MSRLARFAAVAGLFLTVECGGSSQADSHWSNLTVAYSCSGGTPPPSKLILHGQDGVPGQYIVVFRDSVPDVVSTASSLAARYQGQIRYVYTSAFHGFAVKMPDANAQPLSQEAAVCWVEQDTLVHG